MNMKKTEKSGEFLFDENTLTAQVLAVLGTGEQNATTSRQIKRAFGISERDLRKIVEKSRRNGVYILSSNAGYFYPANKGELEEFIRRESRRIKSQCVTLSPMKRYLKRLGGDFYGNEKELTTLL